MSPRVCRFVLATLLLLAPTTRPGAEIVLGGESGLGWDTLINSAAFLESTSDARGYFYPMLYAGTDLYEFAFEGALSYTNRDTQAVFGIRRLFLTASPMEFLSLKAGRFLYLPGAGEFFSCSNFFSPMDLEALIYQRELEILRPADLLQVSVFFWNAYLRLSASSFAPQRAFPDPESPWFPMKDIPETLWVPFPTPHEMTLGSVSLEEEADIPATLSSISFCAETGLSVYGVDLALLYYQGWDIDLITTSAIVFPTGFYGSFDIRITPVNHYVRAVALNLATSIAALRLWIDTAFTFQKSFNTTRLSSSSLSTLLTQQHYWEYTVGASYELPWLDTILVAEFKGDLIVPPDADSADETIVKDVLSSAFVGTVRSAFFDRRLLASALVLVAVADGSTAVQFALSYEPASELRFSLHAPLFFGAEDTELGQFADNHLISASIRWRF